MFLFLRFFFVRLFVQFFLWQLIYLIGCVALILIIPILSWPFLGYVSWPLDYAFSLRIIKVGTVCALLSAVLFFVRDVSLFLKGYR